MQDSPSSATPSGWNSRFRVETYKGADGDHRFRVVSRSNGKTVAVGEGYSRRIDMEKTIHSVFPDALIPEDGPEAAAQPASRDASGATWSVVEFDPTDTAPEGDPELDCDGAPDAS